MNAHPQPQPQSNLTRVFSCPKCHALYTQEQGRCQNRRCNPQKYRNHKVTVDGRTYDSQKECTRWHELCVLQEAGKISHLVYHPSYEIVVAGVYIGKMTLDSRYHDNERNIDVYEDVKGGRVTATRDYRLRKKIVEAIYGIEISEY